jgi:DNA repair protein RadA/Sms
LVALSLEEAAAQADRAPRLTTGMAELNRVLGGGIVPGSVILLGGEPGVGKSTLLLQMAAALGNATGRVLYASGEESLAQIGDRASRLGLQAEGVRLVASTDVGAVLALGHEQRVQLVVIDSIQTMVAGEEGGVLAGTVSQIRAVGQRVVAFAKHHGIAVVLVGHVTKEGVLAGPKLLEHMVDTVLYFEGEKSQAFRLLRAVKHRFGAVHELGVFTMEHGGLVQVANPSALFLSEQQPEVSGVAVYAGMEGSRPILVEIQALVAPSSMAMPRRTVVGWDPNRLAMILAVLATRYGLRLGDKEVYLSIAGGLTIDDPAADLAVAAAIISAARQLPLPEASVWFGEIGLSGEIRSVGQAEGRIREASKLGFRRCFLPASLLKQMDDTGVQMVGLRHIRHTLSDMPESAEA